jgi:hypothetical protein
MPVHGSSIGERYQSVVHVMALITGPCSHIDWHLAA